ncbi:hypothetical protein V1477_008362 [Vespula maculifrons]|uniref:Uncharacterized protein n=1 Tax=Vespula maculifrons TaxID=7453 RepID=A0ABD2CCT6_VESMC
MFNGATNMAHADSILFELRREYSNKEEDRRKDPQAVVVCSLSKLESGQLRLRMEISFQSEYLPSRDSIGDIDAD